MLGYFPFCYVMLCYIRLCCIRFGNLKNIWLSQVTFGCVKFCNVRIGYGYLRFFRLFQGCRVFCATDISATRRQCDPTLVRPYLKNDVSATTTLVRPKNDVSATRRQCDPTLVRPIHKTRRLCDPTLVRPIYKTRRLCDLQVKRDVSATTTLVRPIGKTRRQCDPDPNPAGPYPNPAGPFYC